MKCIQCGAILPDGTKFCTECGAAQPAPVPQPEPSAAPAPQPEPSAAPAPQPEPSAAPAPQPEPSAAPAPQPEPQSPAAPAFTESPQPVPPVYPPQPQPAQPTYTPPQPVQPTYTPPQPAQPTYTPPQPAQPTYTPPQPVQPTYTPPQPAQPTYTPPQPAQPTYTPPQPAQPTYTPPQPVQPTYTPPQQPNQPHNPYMRQSAQQGTPAQQSYPAQQQGYAAQRPPAAPQKKKFNPLLLIPIILGGLVVLAILCILVFRFLPKPTPTDPQTTATVSPTETADPTGSTAPSTEAPKPVDSDMKYKPGHYTSMPYGSIVFYPQYNSPGEDAFYYSAPDGEKAFSVEVTEVKQNENAESDFYLWRGKTTIKGQTGWIDLENWIPTDLNETALSAEDEAYIWYQLEGIWNYILGDRLIRFMTEEDGSHEVLIGVWDSEYDFMGTAETPVYGEKDGLIRITVKGTTDTVSDRGSGEIEISLYIDMTDILSINWSYDREEWYECIFAGYTPEEAHPNM